MEISLLCTGVKHPVNYYLHDWISLKREGRNVSSVRTKSHMKGSDILLSEIIDAYNRSRLDQCLLLHCSDLPKGRGWNPHIWAIIGDANQITLCIFEAEDKSDSGWALNNATLGIPQNALWHKIDDLLFLEEIKLLELTLSNFEKIKLMVQCPLVAPLYLSQRTKLENKVDVHTSIASKFDRSSVRNPERYLAFFDFRGSSCMIYNDKIN
jgi:methionyl-tRNA formyltransferase